MTTPLTPPPTQPSAPSPQRARAGWITPLLAVVGSIALIIAIGSAVLVGIRVFHTGASTDTAGVRGVTALDISSSGAEFTLEYGNVSEAVLDVRGASGWRIENREGTLVVRAPHRWFGSWWLGGEQRVTLTLPSALERQGLDADLVLSSGSLVVEGDFGDLSVKVNAGRAAVSGSARELDVEVNAGHADLDIGDVAEAEFEVNAGRIDAALSGTTPESVGIDVSAGQLNLTVPEDTYNVSSNVSAGSFDGNSLQTASASRHRIDVTVSAGSVIVRPGS